MGSTALQRLVLAEETTSGTEATTGFEAWRSEEPGQIQDARNIGDVTEKVGSVLPNLRTYVASLDGTIDLGSAPASFQQIKHILSAGVSDASEAADGGGSATVYTFSFGVSTPATIKTYTLFTGDDETSDILRLTYGFVQSFTIGSNAGEAVTMEGTFRGRGPTVKSPATWPSTTIPSVSTIVASKGTFAVDDIDGAASAGDTTVSSTVHSWSLSVTTGWDAFWTVDRGSGTAGADEAGLDFAGIRFSGDDFDASATVVWDHDATGITEKGKYTSAARRQFQITMYGADLTTAGSWDKEALQISFSGYYTSISALGDTNGNSTYEASVRIGYDSQANAGAGLALEFVVVHD